VPREGYKLEHIHVKQKGDQGFDSGWFPSDESDSRWMDGTSSRICFNTDGFKKYLEIGYKSAVTPGSKPYSVQMYVNGTRHDSFEVAGNGTEFERSFQLPKHGKGDLLIEFRSALVWKPSDIDPTVADSRRLGAIALRYAVLSEMNLLEGIDVTQNGDKGFRNGWFQSEADGHKWMSGTSSQICFVTDGKKKRLVFGCVAGFNKDNSPFGIEIFVNKNYHQTFEVAGNGNRFVRSFLLPKHKKGDLLIEFRSKFMWKPSDINPDTPDKRQFGAMALRYAELKSHDLMETIEVEKTEDLGFTRGWHSFTAGDHKWMDGSRGEIRFITDGKMNFLKTDFISPGTRGNEPCTFQLYVNGVHHDTFNVPGYGGKITRYHSLPRHEKGDLSIEYRSDHTWIPTDLDPESADSRLYGAMALRRASLIDIDKIENIDVQETGELGFKQGWHLADTKGYRWMDGSKSQLCFLTDGKKKYLELRYISGVPGREEPYSIHVYINGNHHDTINASGFLCRYVKSIKLPKHAKGDLLIEFRSDKTWKPSEFNSLSKDKREYGGMALYHAVLKKEKSEMIENQVLTDKEIKVRKIKVSSFPSWMILCVTSNCNLKCLMCGSNIEGFEKDRGDLTGHRLDKVKKVFPYLAYAGVSGGEPLMFKGFDDVLKDLAKSGVEGVNFYSNGLLLNKDKSDFILRYSDSIEFIGISVDAATEQTYKIIRGGNYNRLIENIRALTSTKKRLGLDKPKIILNYVVTYTNVDELPAFVELAHQLDADEVSLQNMLEGWDFKISRNGIVFDYQKEQIKHYPDLLLDNVQKAIANAEKYKLDFNLSPKLHEIYMTELTKTNPDSKAFIPLKYEYGAGSVQDFSRPMIDLSPGGPICKLPWQKLILYSNGEVYTCCWSDPFANIDNFKSFEDLWNCERLQHIRSELLNGRFAKECRTCNCPSFNNDSKIDTTRI
jgi:MoaA/NifB/PqqE/SkfB family radical SAM enzyme